LLIPCPKKPAVEEKRVFSEFVAKAILKGKFPSIIKIGTINAPPDIPIIPAKIPTIKTRGKTIATGKLYSSTSIFRFQIGPKLMISEFLSDLYKKYADIIKKTEKIIFKYITEMLEEIKPPIKAPVDEKAITNNPVFQSIRDFLLKTISIVNPEIIRINKDVDAA